MNFFTGYDQYVLWHPQYKPSGKIDKIPIGDVTDPKNHMGYAEAAEAVKRSAGRLNIGFAFTENDPFFFVDVDDALLANGEWSERSREIIAGFPGCAVEISHSGKGLHIFGTGAPPPHRNRDDYAGVELYTKRRFVALTGNGATGSAFTDGTAGLRYLVDAYLTPKIRATDDPANWTWEPRPEWTGPEDDDELLKIAMRSKSVGSAFGGAPGFRELFDAETETLAAAYPGNDGAPFNWSSADAALALHLAFYTGCDCGRMERLFERSPLADRDKWRDREDYRRRTILNAAAMCQTVYTGRRETEVAAETAAAKPESGFKTGSQFMGIEAQLNYFRDCVYVVSRHRVFTPDYGMLKPEQFRAAYGGYQFALAAEGRPTKSAFEAFTESRLCSFPRAYGVCFRPENPERLITEEGLTYVNTYAPPIVEIRDGDPRPFLDLLTKLLPDARDRTIMLAYMAACVQYPGIKFQWAPLLQGTEGNGKTFLMTAISKAVGERYSHFPNAADLDGNGLKFTGWLFEKLFIGIEDLTGGKTDLQQAFKPFITNPRMEFQMKGANQFIGDNRANFFFCANPKDALRKTENDRRYCVFYSAQQTKSDITRHGMGGRYFPDLYDWGRGGGFAIIAGYLKNHAIPDEFNPATLCHRAPDTTSTGEAKAAGLSPAAQEIREAVAENRPGFRGGWISSIALDRLLREKNRRVALNKRKSLLESINYTVKERMNSNSILDGGKRPVLYVPADSPLLAVPPGAQTSAAYVEAQGGA